MGFVFEYKPYRRIAKPRNSQSAAFNQNLNTEHTRRHVFNGLLGHCVNLNTHKFKSFEL